MPRIVLPDDISIQPQCAVGLNPNHWLYKDIVFAYSVGRGLYEAAHGTGSMVGALTYGVGPQGRSVRPSDASSYIQFPHHADYNVLGEVSVIAMIRTGGTTVQQGIVTKCETSGGSNTPFGLFTESGGYVSMNRSNAGGGTPFVVWRSAATLITGADYILAATQGADISVAPRFYLNGQYDSSAPTSLYGGTGTGAPTGNTTSLKIGNRTDLASQCFHDIYTAIVVKRIVSASEVSELYYDLRSLWDDPEMDFWFSASSAFNPAWARNANAIITGTAR